MKKKLLSILLMLSVWLSLTPALALPVSAAMVNYIPETPTCTTIPASAEEVESRLAELIAQYDGSYWTSTGQPCETHREACYSKYYNAWQCNGFARYIFAELFGTGDIGSYDGNDPSYIPRPRNAVEVFRVGYVALNDVNTIKSLMGQAMAGDFLQIFDRETGRQHSLIVVSVDSKGVNVLDCNSDGHCGIKYQHLNWKYMGARYEKLSLYRSSVYPAPAASFFDVNESDWFYAPVVWAKSSGITGGKTETTFAPYEGCTRAQVVTFLYAAAGKPEVTASSSPFVDVKPNDWYFAPVMWAVEQGITSGIDATHFGPNETCTRAQVVTFLYANAGKPPVTGQTGFWDVSSTDWYAAPVIWAAQNKVTSGYADGSFAPLNSCPRGEVVTFLYKIFAQ